MNKYYIHAWLYFMTWAGVAILILTAGWVGNVLLQWLLLPVIMLGIFTAVALSPPLWRQSQLYFIKDWITASLDLLTKWLIEVIVAVACFTWGVLVCGPQQANQIMGLYVGLRVSIQMIMAFIL